MIEGEELSTELTPTQKYAICKKFWANTVFTQDEKNALRDKALANDASDAAANCRKVLDWSLPDANLKLRLWDELLDANSNVSLME